MDFGGIKAGVALFSVFSTHLFPEFWHEKGLHAQCIYFEAASVIIGFYIIG